MHACNDRQGKGEGRNGEGESVEETVDHLLAVSAETVRVLGRPRSVIDVSFTCEPLALVAPVSVWGCTGDTMTCTVDEH